MTRREVTPPPDVRVSRGDVTFARRAITDDAGKVTGTVEAYMVCTRLERMWKRGEISQREHKAGSRFIDDLTACEASTRSCLNRDQGGDAIMAIIINGFRMGRAAVRVRDAALVIGPQLADLAIWVGYHGRPASEWADRQGMKRREGAGLLGLALRKLADHYGLDSE